MRDFAIVVAADLPNSAAVMSVVKQVAPIVDGVKVGVPTLLQAGVEILKRIRDLINDKPLLLDLKISDIGFIGNDSWQGTNAKIVKSIEGDWGDSRYGSRLSRPRVRCRSSRNGQGRGHRSVAPAGNEPCWCASVLFTTLEPFGGSVLHHEGRPGYGISTQRVMQ